MRITLDDAREYFAHPSQHLFGITPETLPDEGFEYWANGPICVIFHQAMWPRVWAAHYAVKPEGWGGCVDPAKAVLRLFWASRDVERIIGWTEERNRLACAFARRVGFEVDGRLDLPGGAVVMQGWTPWA